MEPNYKSFVSWKQSKKGASYIQNKDMRDIARIQTQNQAPKSDMPHKNQNTFQSQINRQGMEEQEPIPPQKIYFQIISTEYIDVFFDFEISVQIISILKEFQGSYNRESKSWTVLYRNYTGIFKALQKLTDPSYILVPIALLPIEFLCKTVKLGELKFDSFFKNEKKVSFFIDYSKEPVHSLAELPSHMLASLYKFQKAGINFGIQKCGRFLLADEMGVGKTIQAIGISAIYKENWPVLVICPSSLKLAWRDEIINWLTEIVSKKEVQVFKTSKDNFKEDAKFYVMSYDLSIRLLDKIIKKNFNFIIADEVHYLKNRDSKRSKYLIPIMQRCKRLILLSGTPILAKPVEAYPILNALRPDIFRSFKTFGTRYCNPVLRPFGIDWSGSSNSRELHFLLSRLMIRRLKKDVLSELPPKKRQKVEIQTDKKIINQIRVLMNKSNKINLENSNILNALQKIDEDGNIKDNRGDEDDNALGCFTKAYMLTGKAKIPGIKEYVNYLIDNSCKFLIFAHHSEVLDAIEEEVKKSKIGYMRIDGKVSNEKRHEKVNQFQTDNNCLVAILGITACATGLTLTKASTVVFAELHFTPAIMIQAEDRAHRIGQEHQCVNVHYLFASDTIDEVVFAKLREKHFVVSTTLDNKALDMGVQKIKDKVGDFVKMNGKDGKEGKENKEGVDSNSSRNKTLNDFVKISNNLNLHDESLKQKRSLTDISNNKIKEEKKDNKDDDDDIEAPEDWEKLFLI